MEHGSESAAGEPLRFSLVRLDEVESTNLEVKRLIREGAPEGAAVVARAQTGGYGRQGRSWRSPVGGLYLSVLLRPSPQSAARTELPTLSLAAALAVREALLAFQPAEALYVKWPNDVLCEGGKLCGISLEAVGGAVCLGIGVNVARPEGAAAVGANPSAASAPLASGALPPAYLGELAPACLDGGLERALDRCAACALETLSRFYHTWSEQGFAAMCGEYNRVAYLNGRTVSIASIAGETFARGRVVRTAENGALILEDEAGICREVFSGEAHVRL